MYLSPVEKKAALDLLQAHGSGGWTRCAIQKVDYVSTRSARYWFKAWSPTRFADLALRLLKTFPCSILLGGSSDEREIAETIKKEAQSLPIVLAGETTVRQYAAILQRCSLFIGNDNGPMHMASALGVPVVGLFGPSNPSSLGATRRQVNGTLSGLGLSAMLSSNMYPGRVELYESHNCGRGFSGGNELPGKGRETESLMNRFQEPADYNRICRGV